MEFTIALRNAAASVCSALLILMWVYASLSKLIALDVFESQLSAHDLIKDHAPLVARVVPFFELMIVPALFLPAFRRQGFIASVVLLLVFTAYILYLYNFYPTKPCSCGGVISALSWKEHIVFNLFCMAIGVTGILCGRPVKGISATASSS